MYLFYTNLHFTIKQILTIQLIIILNFIITQSKAKIKATTENSKERDTGEIDNKVQTPKNLNKYDI